MRLLICTQVVDSQDSNLGFFHRWIEEFAKQCEQVTVVCLREGAHILPPNVRVVSLGKEAGTSRIERVYRFIRYIFAYRHDYDAVLVHMNPEYVLLGGFLWRRWGKKIGLWYAHCSRTHKLARAVVLVDRVLTVAPDSFPISTPKLKALGHGIDTALFKPGLRQESLEMRIITTGRVAESKHVVEMLNVLDVLFARGETFTFTIVGVATSPAEERYAARLTKEMTRRPYGEKVRLLGAVAHRELPAVLQNQDLFFNFGSTGNMDKAGLEALACGIPVIATNGAFEQLLAPYGLYVSTMTAEVVADAIEAFMRRPDHPAIATALRNKIVADHSLTNLIPKILIELQ